MIKLENINKSYFGNQVLYNINFEIKKWEIVWLLWPNGAWKSTTMKVMTGFMHPEKWEVLIDWESIFSNNSLKKKIWYLPERNPLHDEMWVDEFLLYIANLKWISDSKNEISKVIKQVGLEDKILSFISTLSKWYRQRVWLAAALIGDPEILVLDEPTEWLDPRQRNEIKDLIISLSESKTIIISSHVLTEISSLVNRVLIISSWKIKLDEATSTILSSSKWQKKLLVSFDWKLTKTELTKKFKDIEVNILEKTWKLNNIEVMSSEDLRQPLFAYLKNKVDIYEFHSEKIQLEDVFHDVVSGWK